MAVYALCIFMCDIPQYSNYHALPLYRLNVVAMETECFVSFPLHLCINFISISNFDITVQILFTKFTK